MATAIRAKVAATITTKPRVPPAAFRPTVFAGSGVENEVAAADEPPQRSALPVIPAITNASLPAVVTIVEPKRPHSYMTSRSGLDRGLTIPEARSLDHALQTQRLSATKQRLRSKRPSTSQKRSQKQQAAGRELGAGDLATARSSASDGYGGGSGISPRLDPLVTSHQPPLSPGRISARGSPGLRVTTDASPSGGSARGNQFVFDTPSSQGNQHLRLPSPPGSASAHPPGTPSQPDSPSRSLKHNPSFSEDATANSHASGANRDVAKAKLAAQRVKEALALAEVCEMLM
jgi:hypothetical protein